MTLDTLPLCSEYAFILPPVFPRYNASLNSKKSLHERLSDEVFQSWPNLPSLYRGHLERINYIETKAVDAVFAEGGI